MGQQSEFGIQKGNVNVVVRVRPLNSSERFANENNVLQFPGNGGIVATTSGQNPDKANLIKSFTFNVVFEPEATQKDVFEHCGIEEMVDLALAGYSTTCICYGQTGSGKTHTLSGPPNMVSQLDLTFKSEFRKRMHERKTFWLGEPVRYATAETQDFFGFSENLSSKNLKANKPKAESDADSRTCKTGVLACVVTTQTQDFFCFTLNLSAKKLS